MNEKQVKDNRRLRREYIERMKRGLRPDKTSPSDIILVVAYGQDIIQLDDDWYEHLHKVGR